MLTLSPQSQQPPARPSPASAPAPKQHLRTNLNTPWTDERNRFLAHFWVHELDKAAGWIAAWLNEHTEGLPIASANAVIGRARRMKLPARDSRQIRRATQARAKQVRGQRSKAAGKPAQPQKEHSPIIYREPVSNVVPLRVPLLLSRDCQCHYVIGRPADGIYCGLPKVDGSLWCAGHRAECTR